MGGQAVAAASTPLVGSRLDFDEEGYQITFKIDTGQGDIIEITPVKGANSAAATSPLNRLNP